MSVGTHEIHAIDAHVRMKAINGDGPGAWRVGLEGAGRGVEVLGCATVCARNGGLWSRASVSRIAVRGLVVVWG